MTNSTQKTPRALSIEQGKDSVIAIIVVLILLEVLGLILKFAEPRFISIVDVVRISVTTVSCVYLYKGRGLAKLYLALSASLGLFYYLYSLYRVITIPSAGFAGFVVILGLTTLCAFAVYYLLFSGDVDEFLKSRKQ